jgi:hypothetical protein
MISYFPVVTGSLTVEGSVNISGGITASGGISISGSIASASFASTASFVALAQSASNAVSAQTASFANTLTVAGNLTAQTLVVQTITSSVDFVTGSTRFGSILGNTHVFSGSVSMNPNGLFVSSSNNVGIGTISPSDFIDAGLGLAIISTSGRTGLSLGSTQGTANEVLGRLSFTNTNSTNIGSKRLTYISGIRGTSDNSAYLEFGTADNALGTQRMVISQAGSVGIGISSPTASLTVVNSVVGTPSIPSLGSVNVYTTAYFTNANPSYGLLMGSLNNGNSWMQVGRVDGSATAYDLQLQPNGGSVNVGGRLNVGGNVVLSQKLITSFTSNPSNVSAGGTTSFSLTQPTFEYQSTYFVSIIGLYAPSGVNQNGFYTGLVTFFNDSSNAQANVSALHANGWSLAVSATTGGTFTGTFTNASGATMSNVWIRILKINKTFDN